ncbi:MAG: GIY-YIG nuclease family protein [Candidatus Liptonbacteria bacterium]
MYFVYVLKNEHENWHCIGSTSNLATRVAKHNNGGVKSTKPHRPLRLVYSESFTTNSEARKREGFLKKTAKARDRDIRQDRKWRHRLARSRTHGSHP